MKGKIVALILCYSEFIVIKESSDAGKLIETIMKHSL